jgi:hypothetical protein
MPVSSISQPRIIQYMQGTLNHSLLLHRTSTSDLIVYTDTD